MTYILRVSFAIFCWIFLYNCRAQDRNLQLGQEGFIVDLILGSNFSQLDGDELVGYRKLGLRTGAQINYQLQKNGGIVVGLVYEEKGSSESFSLGKPDNSLHTSLQFLSIPVDFFFLAGYNPKIRKHRIKYNIGLSIGRLFNVNSNDEQYVEFEKSFSTFDFAPNIGLTYFISKKSGLNLRWERSISNILNEDPENELSALSSYQFSLQYIYTL